MTCYHNELAYGHSELRNCGLILVTRLIPNINKCVTNVQFRQVTGGSQVFIHPPKIGEITVVLPKLVFQNWSSKMGVFSTNGVHLILEA